MHGKPSKLSIHDIEEETQGYLVILGRGREECWRKGGRTRVEEGGEEGWKGRRRGGKRRKSRGEREWIRVKRVSWFKNNCFRKKK